MRHCPVDFVQQLACGFFTDFDYPQIAVVAANAWVMWLVIRGGRTDLFLAGLLGGLALGIQNPLPHLLFAVPLLVWKWITDRRGSVFLIGGYLVSGIPSVLLWPVVRIIVAGGKDLSAGTLYDVFLSGRWFLSNLSSGWAGSKPFYVNMAWLVKQELWSFSGGNVDRVPWTVAGT
jgi:hypothetical protein